MVRAFGGHLRANGIRQHFLRFGEWTVRPILVIPGITSPAATWTNVGSALGRLRDVIILDVRGRGLSESGPDLDYSLDACADDLVEFVRAFGFEGVDIVGHSVGGRIALRAVERIENCARLVLVDPPLSGPDTPMRVKEVDQYLRAIALAKAGAPLDELRKVLPPLAEGDLALRAEWLPTCEEAAIKASHDGLQTDDVWKDIRTVRIPLLVMAAGEPALITSEDLAVIAALQPTSRSIVIESGHMIPMDNWPAFYRALADFLELPRSVPIFPPVNRMELSA
ncbi:alpha/beta hydrolase [Microbacteriaceae bacterium K1510]|nr:alpha/beta hydrolase [Microbacteriaceae bacterium K1510]